MRRPCTAVFATMALLLSAPAQAVEGDVTRILGLGGAGMASPDTVNAVRRAPGAMPLSVGYTAQADGAINPGYRADVGMVDGKTSDFALGFMYSGRWVTRPAVESVLPGWMEVDEDLSEDWFESSYRLAAAYGFLPDRVARGSQRVEVRRLGVGLSGVYHRDLAERTGVINAWQMDASVAGRPTDTLTLAGTVHDILPDEDRPLNAEVGLWYAPIAQVAMAADVAWNPTDDTAIGGRAGVEAIAAEMVPIRVGASWINAQTALAAGFGLWADGAGFDYGVQFSLDPDADVRWVHSIGLTARF